MADLAASITTARNAGYSDADITAYLAKDPTLGPQVAQARKVGYADNEIVDHLATPKPKPSSFVDSVKSYASGLEKGIASAADAVLPFTPLAGLARTSSGNPLGTPAMAAPVGNLFANRATTLAHMPETTAGKYAQAVGQMTPAAALPGSAVGRVVNVVAPALASEGAGQTAEALGAGPKTAAAARAVGGLVGGAGASVRAVSAPKVATMSLDDLQAAKTAAYKAADAAGVRYTPEAFGNMVAKITSNLADARINPIRHPKASSMLEDMQAQAQQGHSPTLTELDQLRQVVRRDVASAPDKAEKFMGTRMIKTIDQFVDNAQPGDVATGNAADAASLIKNARDLNTRARKVEDVTNAVSKAEMRAGSTGSGGNADNAIRQNLRRILEKGSNFTDEEAAALEKIVMGGKGQNLLRQVGKLSPQGNGIMAAANLGAAAAAGPLGAIPGAAGLVSKLVADGMTRGRVQNLIQLMARGGAKSAPNAAPQPARLTFSQNPFAPGAVAMGLSAVPAMAQARRRER